MKFLALNTAGAGGTEAALYNDGKLAVKRDAAVRNAGVAVFRFADELLDGAKLTLNDLDFIGVCIGPGSFTGIRIGLTAARTFCQFSKLKLVPVTLLSVLAYSEPCDKTAVLADAANGYRYAAVFEGESRAAVTAPFVLKEAEVAAFLDTVQKPFKQITEQADKDYTAALAEAVKAAYAQNGATEYQRVTPLYIRKPQAEEKQ